MKADTVRMALEHALDFMGDGVDQDDFALITELSAALASLDAEEGPEVAGQPRGWATFINTLEGYMEGTSTAEDVRQTAVAVEAAPTSSQPTPSQEKK